MLKQIFSFLILSFPLAAGGAPASLAVCGTAGGADGTALPAASQAQLLPLESDRAWGLGILAGRPGPEPATSVGLEADGRYCLQVPRAGMWKVVIQAPGFVRMAYMPLPVSGPLELSPVRLPRDAGARVVVRDADGRPASGVWVTGRSASPRLLGKVAAEGWRVEMRLGRSGSEGRAALARLPGEELEVQAFTSGSVQVAAARVRDSGRLDLPRPSKPRMIEVRDEGGAPLARVEVTLAEHGWPVAVSDEKGRVALAGGPPGPVSLLLQGNDGRGRRIELPEPSPEGGATRLELRTGVPLRGRVMASGDGRGLQGAMVWLGPDPGAFVISGPRGEYSLPSGGHEQLWVWADAIGFLPGAVQADPSGAAGRELALTLQPSISAKGRVVDEAGSPLAGVAVKASAAGGKPGGPPPAGSSSRALTGASGRFELARLRPGTAYEVAVTRAGFARLVVPVSELRPVPLTDLGTLVLRPGARIEGRVTDAKGGPVGGAEVRFRPAAELPARGEEVRLREQPPDAVAGPDGRFVLPDLRPGRPVHVLVSRPGYLPAWVLGVEAPPAEPVTVVLEEASRLMGSLVDQDGGPVAGARVDLRWIGPSAGTVGLEPRRGGGSRSTESGARGEFSFEELAPGGVELSALADGFLPGQPKTLELPPAGELTDVRLVMRRGAVVKGHVLDSRGKPVGGARLRAGPIDASSDADGLYQLPGLSPGVLGLSANHPNYRERIQEINVEPGVNALDLFLEDGFSVSGRTVDEAGDAVGGAQVEIRSEDPRARAARSALSGEDGRFEAVVSEEGSYRLTATHEGFAPGELTGLRVGSTPLKGIEVALGRGTSVVGRLLGLEPEDYAGVVVEARREDGLNPQEAAAAAVDSQGRYAIHHLPPGDWRIRGELAGGRRRAEAAVTVEPGTRQVERDLRFGAGLRFTGRLLYSGEPVTAAHVSLSGLDVTGERSVLSAYDGSFRIEDLAPGHYRLDVLDPARALSHLEDLELTSDREVDLELEASPLAGTVVSAETGEPLAGALVYVYKLVGASEKGSLVTVATDASGRFVVAHVTAGSYLVSARKDKYAPAEQPVEVVAGTPPGAVSLRLTAADGLTLAVRLDSGAVPRFATVSAFDSSGRKVLTDTRVPTDSGFVHFEQFPAGTWNLLVSAPGAAPKRLTAEVPGVVPGVILSQAAPLTVRVPALREAGAAGSITLSLPGGDPFYQVEPGGDVRSRWTVSAGLVTLPDVPAGVWSVRVDGARGGTWLGTAVTDGRTPSQVSLE